MNIFKFETNMKKDKYMQKTAFSGTFENLNNTENNLILLYPEIKYQTIEGFGGAFTESAGYCFSKLNIEAQKGIINDYFSKSGANYTLCRIPIGSCDFALSSYSHSESKSLSDFSIERDKKYIIPFIKEALKLNSNIKFVATPWSPPAFMKDNNTRINGGKLLNEYKLLWAKYLVKFINLYKISGINIDYITIQNEPNASQPWESCTYGADEELDMAINYIAPIFKEEKVKTKLLIWDHNKERLLFRANTMFNNEKSNLITGIAYHYYSGDHFENINLVRSKFNDKLILHTEGCTGYEKSWFKKKSRNIPNAEIYAHDIIGDLNAGSNGYIDWNMMLDFHGGPTHIENSCNAPIMLNRKSDGYDKKMSYYYITHFSKFIKPGAKRIAFSTYTNDLEITAFCNPDNTIIVVILNKGKFSKDFNLCINNKIYKDCIFSHSIITFEISDLQI